MAREMEVSNQLKALNKNHDDLRKSYNDVKIRMHDIDINGRAKIELLQKQIAGAPPSQPDPTLESQFKEVKLKYDKLKNAYNVSIC
jgi:hypothetical protein